MAKFIFREQGDRSCYCDYRLFIEGIEVTKWCLDQVTWSIGGTDSMNTLSFRLANAEDTWILTTKNLCTESGIPESKRWRKTTDLYDESAKYGIWRKKQARNLKDPRTGQWTYPLNPYTPVFHTHDTIRLFIRNPYSYEDLWMPAFTGFIEHHPMTDDYITGVRPLSFNCYCLKGVLKRMRVNINPIQNAANANKEELAQAVSTVNQFIARDAVLGDEAGFYTDLHSARGLNHVLAGKDFKQAVLFLLLGEAATVSHPGSPDSGVITDAIRVLDNYGGALQTTVNVPVAQQAAYNPTDAATTQPHVSGQVGRLERGETIEYPGSGNKILEDWHDLALLGKSRSYLTSRQVDLLGAATTADNLKGSPWNGQVHMLLPSSGTNAARFVQASLNANPDFKQGFNFETRLDMINQICRTLDYQWYVTPIGDVAFEFPMFDFDPDAFGLNKAIFQVKQHLITGNLEDEAGDIPTAMVITGTDAITQLESRRLSGEQRAQDPTRLVIYSPHLAQRLGANVETLSAPVGVGGIADSAGNMNQAQGAEGLEQWGMLQFQKRLGQSSLMTLPLPWRPWLLPNRPLHNEVRERIGLLGNITHTLTTGQPGTTDVQNLYVRTLGPDLKFRYFSSGGSNMPINYAAMYTKSGDTKHSGIVSTRNIGKGSSRGTKAQPGSRVERSQRRPYSTARELKSIPIRLAGIDWMAAKFHSGQPFSQLPDTVLIHSGSSGPALAEYIANPRAEPNSRGASLHTDGKWYRKVSTHFSWSETKRALVQQVSLRIIAWHGGGSRFLRKGGMNYRAYGIELPGPWRSNPRSEQEKQQLRALLIKLKEAIPSLRFITGHEFVLPKLKRDPGPGVNAGWFEGLGYEVFWDSNARNTVEPKISTQDKPEQDPSHVPQSGDKPKCEYCKDI